MDRLAFNSVTLANGLRVHLIPWPVLFTDIRFVVPFGNAHCFGGIAPASAHHLEHVVSHKTSAFPEDRSFQRFIAGHGGYYKAWTGLFTSGYEARVPAGQSMRALTGLIATVFDPIITEDIIALESEALGVERRRKRWFPGTDEIQHYIKTQWLNAEVLNARRVYGDAEDRAAATPASLTSVNKLYHREGMHVFVGGSFNEKEVLSALERIPTLARTDLPIDVNAVEWGQREYHERRFRDVSRYEYNLGMQIGAVTYEDYVFSVVTEKALMDFTFGSLYEWLRHERGLVYELDEFAVFLPHLDVYWALTVPLNEYRHVQEVRAELLDRILGTLNDDNAMQRALDLSEACAAFDFETVGEVIDHAAFLVDMFGRVASESERRATTNTLRDRSTRERLTAKAWSFEKKGELLIIPDG